MDWFRTYTKKKMFSKMRLTWTGRPAKKTDSKSCWDNFLDGIFVKTWYPQKNLNELCYDTIRSAYVNTFKRDKAHISQS